MGWGVRGAAAVKNLHGWDAAGFCKQARLLHRCPWWDGPLVSFSLWTGKTGCTRTLSSWKFPRLTHRTLRSPGHRFSTETNIWTNDDRPFNLMRCGMLILHFYKSIISDGWQLTSTMSSSNSSQKS